MDDILVKIENATASRTGRAILSGVDLELRRGRILMVIGPNGAGKTTLAHVILGLAALDGGRLTRAPGLRIGYVPQGFETTHAVPVKVRDFLHLPRRRPKGEVEEALELLGAGELADRPLQVLSGGEMKRVLLARSLLGRPDLLLFDEPAAFMDADGQSAFYAFAAELPQRRDCGMMLISHDIHHVMSASNEVLCLNNHICCRGAPGEQEAGDESLSVYHHRHDHSHNPLPPRPAP